MRAAEDTHGDNGDATGGGCGGAGRSVSDLPGLKERIGILKKVSSQTNRTCQLRAPSGGVEQSDSVFFSLLLLVPSYRNTDIVLPSFFQIDFMELLDASPELAACGLRHFDAFSLLVA